MPPSPRRGLLSSSQYFAVEPDGLKLKTPAGPGDGVRLFDDAQLRTAHPGIAEDAIAFRDAGPSGPFTAVLIDQVQDSVVRLRGEYGSGSDGDGAAGRGISHSKLLPGRSLGHARGAFGTQLTLLGAPASDPVTAHDEAGRALSNEQLQARERGAPAPTQWKLWYSRSRDVWFAAPASASASAGAEPRD